MTKKSMLNLTLYDLSFFENKYEEISDRSAELTEREEFEAIREMYDELQRIMTTELPTEPIESSKFTWN